MTRDMFHPRRALGALLMTLALAGAAPVLAADPLVGAQQVSIAGSDAGAQFVPLGIGKSIVIDVPRDIKDVLVADPRIANAVVRSSRRAYIIGVAVGQTNVYFFDANGQQITGLDIAVTRDLNGLRAALRQMFPNADIRIEGVGDGVVLSGTVTNAAESQQAFDIAARLVGDGSKITNAITITGRDQVMIKVTVAEMQRDVIKQLGVDLTGLAKGGGSLAYAVVNPFSAFGSAIGNSSATATFNSITATLRAMERAGVVRTLAEPNLTAISGESAYFLAGGEFPIPANFTCDPTTRSCQVAVQFKKFGVGLNFTPVVLSEGRISLKIMSEVSELSTENALTLTQSLGNNNNQTLTIPSIRTRRAETTLEIPSGGTMAMAGLIQEQTRQAINGTPGLMQVPILGALFKSRDYINRQTELVVMATPYIVRAVAQKELSRPDDGFADPSDPAAILLGRLNRIYGTPRARTETAAAVAPRPVRVDPPATGSIPTANAAAAPAASPTAPAYRGSYGFILD